MEAQYKKDKNHWSNLVRPVKHYYNNTALQHLDTNNVWKTAKRADPAHQIYIKYINRKQEFNKEAQKIYSSLLPTLSQLTTRFPLLRSPFENLSSQLNHITLNKIHDTMDLCQRASILEPDNNPYRIILTNN